MIIFGLKDAFNTLCAGAGKKTVEMSKEQKERVNIKKEI